MIHPNTNANSERPKNCIFFIISTSRGRLNCLEKMTSHIIKANEAMTRLLPQFPYKLLLGMCLELFSQVMVTFTAK